MKYRAFTLLQTVLLLVFLGIVAAVLFPVLLPDDRDKHRSSCSSNLKQIALSFAQYIQDYDEKYPPTKNATGAWADLLQPYAKSTQLFHCPADKSGALATSDYFYNARLSGVSMNKIPAITITILTGDGLLNQPFDAHLTQLPDAWRQDQNSPAYRHLDGAFYAFADGHVKWYKPQNITLKNPNAEKPTFLVK